MDTVRRRKDRPRPAAPVARLVQPVAPPPTAAGAVPVAGPPQRRWRRWAGLVVLLGVIAATGYWFTLPPAVVVVQPHRGPAVQAVYATGTVEPTVMIPIAARSAARLVELHADEGDHVTKGEVLARLENDDLRRAVDVAEAEERYAKAEFDRQGQLVDRQVVARSAYDRAKADWEKAKAATERARAEAGFLLLVAPADGTVIRRDGEIGQLIGANQTVFWLSCCAPLRISAEVDEEDVARIRPGQEVLIRSDAFPGRIFDGRVQAVTPKGDPVARTYRVRISLPQDAPLMIGMTTETNIELRRDEHALLLPAGAVRGDTVWQVKDDRLVARHVEIGAKGPREVEIRAGIADGDTIVATPAADLRAGERVRPVTAAAPR